MTQKLAAFATVACLFLSAPAGAQTADVPSLADALSAAGPSIVSVEVKSTRPLQQLPGTIRPLAPRADTLFGTSETVRLSGVVVDGEEGQILTNYAGEPSAKFTVAPGDGRELEAELLGIDRRSGLALLDVNADDLVAIEPVQDGALTVGDPVALISNPFGSVPIARLDHVSALGHATITPQSVSDFLLVGASAEGTKRGAALVTLDGDWAGLMVESEDATRSAGLAMPAWSALAIADSLAQFGEVPSGRLGVMIQDLTPDIAEQLGFEVSTGAIISAVADASAASEAGLREGDIIVDINGREISDATTLRSVVGALRVGDTVSVEFVRDGERQTVETALKGEHEESAVPAVAPDRVSDVSANGTV